MVLLVEVREELTLEGQLLHKKQVGAVESSLMTHLGWVVKGPDSSIGGYLGWVGLGWVGLELPF